MFYFFRGKDKPTRPDKEALNSFLRLVRMKGITQRPPLKDVWDIFCDFSELPFLAETDELLFVKEGKWLMLERRFKTESGFGVLVIELDYPDEYSQDIEIVRLTSERKLFMHAVKDSATYKAYRNQSPLGMQVHYYQ